MSAKDKAAVKASLASYLIGRTETTIRDCREHVITDTGLMFGQTTIARFISDMGWGKQGCDAFTTVYVRERA